MKTWKLVLIQAGFLVFVGMVVTSITHGDEAAVRSLARELLGRRWIGIADGCAITGVIIENGRVTSGPVTQPETVCAGSHLSFKKLADGKRMILVASGSVEDELHAAVSEHNSEIPLSIGSRTRKEKYRNSTVLNVSTTKSNSITCKNQETTIIGQSKDVESFDLKISKTAKGILVTFPYSEVYNNGKQEPQPTYSHIQAEAFQFIEER